ncbi:ribonuclease HII [Candidatus Pacearchaeota archaeon]|nr:ribonuclease HII [Candidatus Pacearchaeota archaeon]
MFKLGIDDAGRGPVIGPMILAGCLTDEKTEAKFKKLGVKDSKQLTQKRREVLEKIIKEESETFEIVIIHPDEIDGKNAKGTNLNALEALACAKIINRINKGFKKIKVIVDCPSVNITTWQDFLKTKIKNLSNLEISCEHKADKNHVCVSAASVLAKCVREKEMARLKKQYGNGIGSGYTSDPLTQKFVGNHAQKYKNNGIFRKTWKTWKNASAKTDQKKLGDF